MDRHDCRDDASPGQMESPVPSKSDWKGPALPLSVLATPVDTGGHPELPLARPAPGSSSALFLCEIIIFLSSINLWCFGACCL